jgi:hypothetical protein
MRGKKTGGRKPGSLNKVPGNMRLQVGIFLKKNWNQVQADFNSLEPRDRLLFMEKLLKYTTPALSSMDATFDGTIDYNKLSAHDLDYIFNKITAAANEPG